MSETKRDARVALRDRRFFSYYQYMYTKVVVFDGSTL